MQETGVLISRKNSGKQTEFQSTRRGERGEGGRRRTFAAFLVSVRGILFLLPLFTTTQRKNYRTFPQGSLSPFAFFTFHTRTRNCIHISQLYLFIQNRIRILERGEGEKVHEEGSEHLHAYRLRKTPTRSPPRRPASNGTGVAVVKPMVHVGSCLA